MTKNTLAIYENESMSKSLYQYLTFAIACVGTLSLTPIAFAGEGGAAGAAAFTIQGGEVTGVAVSAAVGKQDAFAGALNDPAGVAANTAFALGSAGVITVTSVDQTTGFTDVQGSADADLGTDQGNTFGSQAATVLIGNTSGDAVVDLGPTP